MVLLPMKWSVKHIGFALILLFFVSACKEKSIQSDSELVVDTQLEAPEFNEDSAFAYIEKQVNFGPRVPGSSAHAQCSEWLIAKLKEFGAEVYVQRTELKSPVGKMVPCINIIASYNKAAEARILLCAHWDTRPWADQDIERTEQPIDGANDGASGVGVLLEVARQLQSKTLSSGVDIIFFDVEDSGVSGQEDSYCLGSQYWGKNLHVPGYRASAGILLDMVGAKNALFTMEGTSMQIAPEFVKQVWSTAHALGHGKHFSYSITSPIIDDHMYVYRLTGIPMIDIIQHEPASASGFGHYWHTHKDNLSVIDKSTLNAVGETVLSVVLAY